MEHVWWPLAALIFGVFFLVFFASQIRGFLARVKSVGKDGVHAEGSTPVQGAQDERTAAEWQDVVARYDSPLVAEIEQYVVRTLDEKGVAGRDRERALLRELAVSYIFREFDMLAMLIYKSQWTFMDALNTAGRPLPHETARAVYNLAAELNPEAYQDYTLEQWLGFMRVRTLIAPNEQGWAITGRGREFLRHLVAVGRPITNPY